MDAGPVREGTGGIASSRPGGAGSAGAGGGGHAGGTEGTVAAGSGVAAGGCCGWTVLKLGTAATRGGGGRVAAAGAATVGALARRPGMPGTDAAVGTGGSGRVFGGPDRDGGGCRGLSVGVLSSRGGGSGGAECLWGRGGGIADGDCEVDALRFESRSLRRVAREERMRDTIGSDGDVLGSCGWPEDAGGVRALVGTAATWAAVAARSCRGWEPGALIPPGGRIVVRSGGPGRDSDGSPRMALTTGREDSRNDTVAGGRGAAASAAPEPLPMRASVSTLPLEPGPLPTAARDTAGWSNLLRRCLLRPPFGLRSVAPLGSTTASTPAWNGATPSAGRGGAPGAAAPAGGGCGEARVAAVVVGAYNGCLTGGPGSPAPGRPGGKALLPALAALGSVISG